MCPKERYWGYCEKCNQEKEKSKAFKKPPRLKYDDHKILQKWNLTN